MSDLEGLEAKLDRLTRLIGTDEGFYILALHSFIEYYLRYEKRYGEGPKFPDLTWRFREELLQEYGDTFIEGLSSLGKIGHQHIYTNKVRHAFEALDSQEAAAATHLFITFCTLAGISTASQIHLLEKNLDIWGNRTSLMEQNSIIRHMQEELKKLEKSNRDLLAKKQEYDQLKGKLKELQVRVADTDLELQKRKNIAENRDVKVDRLRKERNTLVEERNELLDKMDEYKELEIYLRYLGRLSIFTTTRMDYERSLSELTPEQEEAVSAITLKKDFLVKGGAGTGKSLVLIESLRRSALQDEFDFGKNESVVLVTFTRTLAKYNRYIAELMGMNVPLELISTVDTLFYNKLNLIWPGVGYDFTLLDTFFTSGNLPPFMTREEMKSEVENFIFGNGITKEEYLEKMTPRTGMRKRLSREQRENVWAITEVFIEMMEKRGRFTKNYGRLKLLRYLTEHRGDKRIRDISYLFLDEVQDLTPTALMVLRELTRAAMVMAGDIDQSLYNYRPPFARAGMNLRGTTRILKTNFRNTVQIHALAEAFRKRVEGEEWDNYSRPLPFREGPDPELYEAASARQCLDELVQKVQIFTADIGYDPENICILVPRNRHIQEVAEHLGSAGFDSAVISEAEFEFSRRGSVRVSTLHSSKGVDFPVVLLYIPSLYRRPQYAEDEVERLLRNLIYVGITRAMDNLNVFTAEPAASGDPILKDLVACFEEL